jgi:hypothetical protein
MSRLKDERTVLPVAFPTVPKVRALQIQNSGNYQDHTCSTTILLLVLLAQQQGQQTKELVGRE